MKNKASALVKRLILLLSSISEMKLLGVKRNIVAMKARVHTLSWLSSRKLALCSVPLRLHALLGRKVIGKETEEADDLTKAIDLPISGSHSNAGDDVTELYIHEGDNVGEDVDGDVVRVDDGCEQDYPYSLADDDDVEEDMGALVSGSVIEMAKLAKENDGEDFSLEGEIDHMADLFIKRFHKQIRLQKLESFKRYQDMLERGT